MLENVINSESIIRLLNVFWRVLLLNFILCFCVRYCKEKIFFVFMIWIIFCKWYFEKFNLKILYNY